MSTAPTPPPVWASGHGETVLIIEDDASLRSAMALAFTRLNYRVLEAPSAGVALEHWLADRARIKVVVSDNDLGRKGMGLELVRRFSKEEPDTLCILASGSLSVAQMKELQATTRIRCLPKPYTLTELFALVRDGLDSHFSHP